MRVLIYLITSDVSFEAERKEKKNKQWPELLLPQKTQDLGDREVILRHPQVVEQIHKNARLRETPKLLICFKEWNTKCA